MNNKLKKLINNKILSKDQIKAASSEKLQLLENEIIFQALESNHIKVEDVLNMSDFAFQALSYPSVKKCMLKKMSKFNIFYKKFNVKNILKIKTNKEFALVLKEAQKMIKKSPFSIFMIPTNIHDEIHQLKTQLFGI